MGKNEFHMVTGDKTCPALPMQSPNHCMVENPWTCWSWKNHPNGSEKARCFLYELRRHDMRRLGRSRPGHHIDTVGTPVGAKRSIGVRTRKRLNARWSPTPFVFDPFLPTKSYVPRSRGQDDLALKLLWLLQALAAEAPTERWADTMNEALSPAMSIPDWLGHGYEQIGQHPSVTRRIEQGWGSFWGIPVFLGRFCWNTGQVWSFWGTHRDGQLFSG